MGVHSDFSEHVANLMYFKDGEAVRSLFALATPLVPLLLLIACGVAEVFSPGLGDLLAIQ